MSRRTAATAVGCLFITATAMGVLSAVLLNSQYASDSLATAAARTDQLTLGALAVLIMTVAIAMIPAVIFPILKERGEALAIGYAVARTVEVVLLLPAAICSIVLVRVSQEYAAAGSPTNSTHFDTLRTLLLSYGEWGGPATAIFFCLSAVLLNYGLYRTRIVPRTISVWGLAGVAPYLTANVLLMFGVVSASSAPYSLLLVPLALNEMAFAIWLLVKGFAATSRTAETQPR